MCVRHTGGTAVGAVGRRRGRGGDVLRAPGQQREPARGECDGSEVIPQTWRLTQLSWRIKTNTAAAALNT